jgi:hypothetical protein
MGHPSAAAEVSVIHEKHWTRSRLDEALQALWSVETGGKWLPTNRARGQCSVTALVVKDILRRRHPQDRRGWLLALL